MAVSGSFVIHVISYFLEMARDSIWKVCMFGIVQSESAFE